MTVTSGMKVYRIGVDVGGTNTDAVVACRREQPADAIPHHTVDASDIEILTSYKSQTTPDVTTGIRNAVEVVLAEANVPHDSVISVNIGTTHFINAVVQADSVNLSRVAVLRLCGPFGREVPAFSDFPESLRQILEGYTAYLDGGLEIDGRVIRPVKEGEVISHAGEIRKRGISTVVVVGVFSPLDTDGETQEGHVKRILQHEIPGIDVVCSRDIGRVGFVERENAAILNGSILKFARKTIHSYQTAIAELGLRCPLYLTQNDGTILEASAAAQTPIKTFSSGATNSLTGAIFLAGLHRKGSPFDPKTSQVIMADIGGTTSDFAALSPSGFPRPASATARIGGVRTAFSMPEVLSIGLGGGSLVQSEDSGRMSVGPVSVGHRLQQEARCFGGNTLTATDIACAGGAPDGGLPAWVPDVPPEVISGAAKQITALLEEAIDTMKTSELDVYLLLVGGGSIIQPAKLKNVKECIRPAFYTVANAVGAAIAKVSGEVDRIVIPNGRSHDEIVRSVTAECISLAYQNGAVEGSAEVMEMDLIPLQYVTNNAMRVVAKATGELQWTPLAADLRNCHTTLMNGHSDEAEPVPAQGKKNPKPNHALGIQSLEDYIPEVNKVTGEWFVSDIDLEFLGEGCGILGTGGGGSVYSSLLHAREVLRSLPEKRMRIIEPSGLSADSKTALVAYVGAPSVSNERLISGDELSMASEDLSQYLGIKGYDGIMPAEIGGSNGMRPFASAALMDLPVVDADTMGRAFPKVDMALPYVYDKASPAPAVLSDARGNVQVIARVEDSHRFENVVRVAAVELGLYAALSLAPLSKSVVEEYCCGGVLSLAWFIGRAIHIARQKKTDVRQALIDAVPGTKLLYTGKIVDVRREIKGGWTIGTATLEPFNDYKIDEAQVSDTRELMLSYQNEFFSAILHDRTKPSDPETLCITPDLITVIDLYTGSALATHELRYGLRVGVIAMPAHPLWKTEQGLKAGGPQAFGLDHQYQPYGAEWEKPPSVFSTYGR